MATQTNVWGLVIGWAIVAFLIGGFLGALVFSTQTTKEVEVEKIVEVPTEVITEVEVIKEVPAEVGINHFLDLAVDEFIAVLGDRDYDYLLECDLSEYDEDEVTLRKTSDGFFTEVDDEDEYSVFFEAKLRYKDDFDKCYQWWDVEVNYDEDDVEVFATPI